MTNSVSLGGISKLRDLMQLYCFEYGEFVLSSGRTSPYYYDGKRATLHPQTKHLIGPALAKVISASGAEAVGGIEIGSVPIAEAVSNACYATGEILPTFIVRKAPKTHGTKDVVAQAFVEDGELLRPGRRVAIVDDVVTTGGSIQKAVDVVEELGCQITLIAVLVERYEGGGDALRGRGYDVVSLFHANEDGELSISATFVERLKAAAAVAN